MRQESWQLVILEEPLPHIMLRKPASGRDGGDEFCPLRTMKHGTQQIQFPVHGSGFPSHGQTLLLKPFYGCLIDAGNRMLPEGIEQGA
jgi:hypothetical protein